MAVAAAAALNVAKAIILAVILVVTVVVVVVVVVDVAVAVVVSGVVVVVDAADANADQHSALGQTASHSTVPSTFLSHAPCPQHDRFAKIACAPGKPSVDVCEGGFICTTPPHSSVARLCAKARTNYAC